MNFREQTSGELLSLQALRERLPNTLIFEGDEDLDLVDLGFDQVYTVAPPEPSPDELLEPRPPALVAGRWEIQWALVPKSAAQLAAARAGLTAEIDAAVAAITARYAPFLEEYKTRETQARAFAAANFTGTVPQQVAAFAAPAGLSAQVATLTIIGQADGLRAAQDALGVLRMRKYEVMRAATPEAARAAHAEVMAGIRGIAAGLT